MRIFITTALFFWVVQATANTPDLNLFQSHYPASNTINNFSCATCHMNIAQNTDLNNYGNAYLAQGRGLFASFTAIEAMDSDGDGFTNIAEITAGSNPGDPTSTPNNVPAPVVTGPGTSGSGPSAAAASGLDNNNKNMLGNTGCGLVASMNGDGPNSNGSGGAPVVLLLFALPLIMIAFLRIGLQTLFMRGNFARF